MGLRGFIAALLQPCESLAQAMLTALCLLLLAAGIGAGAYACIAFAESARATLPEFPVHPSLAHNRARTDLYITMGVWYTIGGLVGIASVFVAACAVIVGLRALLPSKRTQAENTR